MNLDEAQRKKVAEWIAQGLKLSDIQNRLASDLGVRMTYMDVRLLVDDLKLTPKDVEPPKPAASALTAGASPASANRPGPVGAKGQPPGGAKAKESAPAARPGKVSIAVDHLARPGALVSGNVTFSDGNQAEWYIDQGGRLGLVPQQTGYRPPATDLQQFQMALDSELSRMGL
jgi:hypothetical protein